MVLSSCPVSRERLAHPADLVVDEGDRAVIGAARGADVLSVDRRIVHVADMAEPARMGIELVAAGADARQVDLVVAVAVPVFARDGEGIVRMGHRHDHAERPLVAPARDVVELPARRRRPPPRRSRAGWCARTSPASSDRTHVVVPGRPVGRAGPSPASSRSRPGRCRWSAAARSREAGPARRNASCRHRIGLVAGVAQVMREGRDVGRELGRVVVGADGRRQPPGHEDVAGRRAERAVAVGGLERDAAGRQRIDIRRLRRSAAIGREHAGSKLIRHQYQYVRPTCHFSHAPLLFPRPAWKKRDRRELFRVPQLGAGD